MIALRKIISGLVIIIFIIIAYSIFSSSLKTDDYIHFLKNSFVDDVSNINNQFIGFKGNVISTEKNITSKFGNIPVIFYKLEYQKYVCDRVGQDDECYWKTYKTESYSTPFVVKINNVNIKVKPKDSNFITKNFEIVNLTQADDYRTLQYIIKKENPVYIWGLLQNKEIKPFNDIKHNKKIFIITDNAKQTLSDLILDVLYKQILSAVFIFIMFIILLFINYRQKGISYLAKDTFFIPFKKFIKLNKIKEKRR